jgi:toxin-antitoxin system PIN domain toxin
MTPDVNVLVAASRADHPHHAVALAWLNQAASGAAPALSLLGTAVASFLRLVTHPRIFAEPTPTGQAVAFVDALLGVPGVRWLPMRDEWTHLRRLSLEQRLAGNAMPDAWIAACVLQQQETLATFDKDFVRLLPPQRLHLLSPA